MIQAIKLKEIETTNSKYSIIFSVILSICTMLLLLNADLFFSGIIFTIALAITGFTCSRLTLGQEFKHQIKKYSRLIVLFFVVTLLIAILRSYFGFSPPSDIQIDAEYLVMISSGLSWIGLFASNFLLLIFNLKLFGWIRNK